jgi:hypothetical protein
MAATNGFSGLAVYGRAKIKLRAIVAIIAAAPN